MFTRLFTELQRIRPILVLGFALTVNQASAVTAPRSNPSGDPNDVGLAHSTKDTLQTGSPLARNLRISWERPIAQLLSPPVASHGLVLCFSKDGVLRAFDLRTGLTKWQADLGRFVGQGLQFGIRASQTGGKPGALLPVPPPVFTSIRGGHGDAVVATCSGRSEGHIFVLDLKSGGIKWHYVSQHGKDGPFDGPILSGIALAEDRMTVRTGGGLTTLRLSDGKLLWRGLFDINAIKKFFPIGRPAVSNGLLFVGADLGVARAIDLNDGRQVWAMQTDSLQQVKTAMIAREILTPNRCDPLLAAGRLFTADGKGFVYALNPSDGHVIWKAHVGQTIQFAWFGNSLLAVCEKGLVELDPMAGQLRRTFSIPMGAFSCVLMSRRGSDPFALVTGLPFRAPGFYIVDLTHWREVWKADDFRSRYGIAFADGVVVAAGQAVTPPATANDGETASEPDTKMVINGSAVIATAPQSSSSGQYYQSPQQPPTILRAYVSVPDGPSRVGNGNHTTLSGEGG